MAKGKVWNPNNVHMSKPARNLISTASYAAIVAGNTRRDAITVLPGARLATRVEKKNHFAKMCRKEKAHQVSEQTDADSSDAEFLHTVTEKLAT